VDLRLDPLMAVLEKIVAFLKAIVAAIAGLFTPQTTTDSLSVSTTGNLGPLGQFILSLSCDEVARTAWMTNRQQAIANSGLSQNNQNLLTGGNLTQIVAQVVSESGGSGSRLWICIWIR
jgi:hypothetical protein